MVIHTYEDLLTQYDNYVLGRNDFMNAIYDGPIALLRYFVRVARRALV